MSAVLRTLADIINNQSVTSVATLQSRFTANSYSSTLTSAFDATNSTIIRTNAAANTVAHVAVDLAGSNQYSTYQQLIFTLRQPVYDSPSNYVYTQIRPGSVITSQQFYMDVGTTVTGGTMSSSQVALTFSEADTSGSAQGTSLTLGGNNVGWSPGYPFVSPSNGWDNIRTFWAYITDKCFFWATTNGTSYNVGWGTTYTDSTKQCGPFIQTQYTRYDYHNTMSNNITPVMFNNQRSATGIGFGTSGDLTGVQNVLYTTAINPPFRVHSLISAAPQVGTSWPRQTGQLVNTTIAGRSSAFYPLNSAQVQGTTTSGTTLTYAGAVSTVSSTRYPNPTLTSTGFAMIPWGWELSYVGNHGGNATDQNGVYVFNGDYVPGDTFTYNNKIYMVWPMYSGYSNRIGFAVPME